MTATNSPTLTDSAVRLASSIWKKSGLRSTPLATFANYISHYPIPFGLTSAHGTLYGWNIHERLHHHEPETVTFFEKNIKPGDSVADIGANIGYFALLFSDLVGENGKVVSFEPSPEAYKNLHRAAQGRKNITVENKGVFSKNDTLTLHSRRGGDPMGSLMYERGARSTKVPVIMLRDYGATFNWAKIDVEGAELEVLRGMASPVRAVLEVAKGIIEDYGGGVEKFFYEIENLGYTIYFIVENGETIRYDHTNIKTLKDNIYIEPKQNT